MITRRNLILTAAALPAAMAVATPALAAKPQIFAKRGLAIRGYDPVAYFTQSMPVKGSSDFTTNYMGATWQFASAENLALFEADPAGYAPQYGGYCSFAVAHGYTAKTDADAWTVHDGKLYLNYNKSVRSKWLKDVEGFVARANDNWPKVLEA